MEKIPVSGRDLGARHPRVTIHGGTFFSYTSLNPSSFAPHFVIHLLQVLGLFRLRLMTEGRDGNLTLLHVLYLREMIAVYRSLLGMRNAPGSSPGGEIINGFVV